ncbi:MAG: dTDP-glucose 4,6-dehydratase [bacterium]
MADLKNTFLVTGGAGFIGSNFVLRTLSAMETPYVVNLDQLTYAGNLENLKKIENHPHYRFVQGNIADRGLVRSLLETHRPRAILHFAAESHVDRSILGPEAFIQTNVVGTFHLLEEAKDYWAKLPDGQKQDFRFLHVSTDEVYGSLGPQDPAFEESTPYAPNSPYAASKAASDHLVRAYHHTYGLPTLLSNCSNNYGPYQFPEKLIPLTLLNALEGKPIPLYGDGLNVRDWLYVEDHCKAVAMILKKGKPGESYNIGGRSEKTNLEIVKLICAVLDEVRPDSPHRPHSSLIAFVKDRPGHDRRYAINCRKIETELGWEPEESFESGIRKTVRWYLDHPEWIQSVKSGDYRRWIEQNYKER